MRKSFIWVLVLNLLVSVVGVPVYAQERIQTPYYPDEFTAPTRYSQPPAGTANEIVIAADAFILRPLGIAACAIGIAGSILALPFAITSRSEDRLGQQFIKKPFEYTFTRPLGDVRRETDK
jgi:hypothetical protein